MNALAAVPSLTPALPEIILALGAMVLLMLGAFQGERATHTVNAAAFILLVIAGGPTLRTPDGERRLGPGDTVCFPAGAAGAHSVRGPGRVLILSANRSPSISVYPDSDKLGTRPAVEDDRLNFRRADAVDYWEGET